MRNVSEKLYDRKSYYHCYSVKLHMYLRKEGFECIDCIYNELTRKSKWIYKMTNALSRELILWTNNKPV